MHIRQQDNNWIRCRRQVALSRWGSTRVSSRPCRSPDRRAGTAVRISAETLTEMIEYTIFAVSADETRVNLNGIHVEQAEGNRLRLVATDGHRLAMISRPVEKAELDKAVTIPRKAVMELRKVLETGDDPIDIDVQGGVAHARLGRVQMSMRLVEGEFPDYHQVIPAKSGASRRSTPPTCWPRCVASRWCQ